MILALIQARMGSTRLPGKSMALLAGIPLIEHVIARVRATKHVDHLCVCTTDDPSDDPLAAHVESLGADLYRGSQTDVLGRFYWAAERYPEANPIVRITADDPFKDPTLIDQLVTAFVLEWGKPDPKLGAPEYMELGGATWPTGLGVEIFTRDALRLAFQRAYTASDREHVTPWMQRNFFRWMLKDTLGRKNANTRWTIDMAADLAFAQGVYDQLFPTNPVFGFDELLAAGY